MENFLKKITKDVDLSFAILLSFCVYVFFAINIEVFFSHNISFAILERFAVLGLVGLALTICIIAGEIDLSIGSNAALCAVIVVKLTDPLGAPLAMIIGLSVSTLIGATQGFVIAFIRIRAIVITVGTLMLLRGVALLIAEEKTVMLTDFRVPDFITTKVLMYFSPASLTVIFIFICVGIFMRYTKYGREIYAIGGARKEALTAGIPLRRPMIIAFALSGFCAGFAGTVIGLKSGTAQGLGLQYLLLAGTVAAFVGGVSILGGKGGVLGAAIGALTVNTDVLPGAEQLKDIRNVINKKKAKCIFSEPQFNPSIINAIAKDTNIKTGVLDPLGSTLPADKNQYFILIKNISNSLKPC